MDTSIDRNNTNLIGVCIMDCIGLFLALSMHIGLDHSYNNVHPHARCTIDNTITGVYYNSENNISTYIGKTYELDEYWNIELGLVTGYRSKNILPMIRYKSGNLFLSPAYEEYEDNKNYGIVIGWEIGK